MRFSDVHLITDTSVLQEQTYIINHIFHLPSVEVRLINGSYGQTFNSYVLRLYGCYLKKLHQHQPK